MASSTKSESSTFYASILTSFSMESVDSSGTSFVGSVFTCFQEGDYKPAKTSPPGARKPLPTPRLPPTPKPPPLIAPHPRRTNFHDMSAMDLVSQLQQLSVGREDVPPAGKDVPLSAMKHQADVSDKPSPPYHPASLQSLLGVPTTPSQQDRKPPPKGKQVDFDFSSNSHHIVCTHKINYRTYNAQQADPTMSSLVDRGANGGISGGDVHIHCLSNRKVNVISIEGHQMPDLRIELF